MYDGNFIVFGGQDLKEGMLCSAWKLNIDEVIKNSQSVESEILTKWEYMKCTGAVPQPLSHHTAFVYEDQLYCYGGILGAQGQISNGDFFILDL